MIFVSNTQVPLNCQFKTPFKKIIFQNIELFLDIPKTEILKQLVIWSTLSSCLSFLIPILLKHIGNICDFLLHGVSNHTLYTFIYSLYIHTYTTSIHKYTYELHTIHYTIFYKIGGTFGILSLLKLIGYKHNK